MVNLVARAIEYKGRLEFYRPADIDRRESTIRYFELSTSEYFLETEVRVWFVDGDPHRPLLAVSTNKDNLLREPGVGHLRGRDKKRSGQCFNDGSLDFSHDKNPSIARNSMFL
jgi:hypothetical protein